MRYPSRGCGRRGLQASLVVWAAMLAVSPSAPGFGVFPLGSMRGSRWDAAPRTFGEEIQLERALDGGLRYSLQTGSYAGFRDLFTWAGEAPAVEQFTAAIEAAFDAWTVVDPATGLGTDLYFVPDLGTAVDRTIDYDIRLGSEIDLFAATAAGTWSVGDPIRRGEAGFSTTMTELQRVTLTSGVGNYIANPITGADITLNCNAQALWDLPTFQTLLTHEIGHTLGLADVDVVAGPNSYFIDDNYDGSTSQSAAATLTNSFALLINPLNPHKSPLRMYYVADGDPGMDSAGVEILMESRIAREIIGRAQPLGNDDFAGRQYLYPYTGPLIPEPGTFLGLLAVLPFISVRGR